MKKTLLICPHYPLPETNGSNMRTMHFVRYFQQFGSVDIAYNNRQIDKDPRQDNLRDLNRIWPSQLSVRRASSLVTGPNPDNGAVFRTKLQLNLQDALDMKREFLLGALNRTPFPVFRYEKASKDALMALIKDENYDYILVRYLYPAGLIENFPEEIQRRVILDIDDVLSGSLYDQLTNGAGGRLKKKLLAFNRRLLQSYERKWCARVVSLVASESDRQKFIARGSRGSRAPIFVPNIYVPASPMTASSDGFYNGNRLLFVGALDYSPNTEGLRWFLESIFPTFRETYPDAHLSVVGRNPTDEIRSLCDRTTGVELSPNVDDILGFYASSRVVVVPLLAGGGTRIKILEAAYASRPVLSTRIGAEGLDLSDGRDLSLFENAAQFVSAYTKLADRKEYAAIAESARNSCSAKYSSGALEGTMTSVLNAIDGEAPRLVAEDSE